MGFTAQSLTDQTGRTFVITGANSGIGLEAARALAGKGARVVMACRDPGRAADALASIRAASPDCRAETVALDLASLASIRACAAELRQRLPHIDVLINNAGVMALPRMNTADGFEMQFGTNHLGHFALTGLLLDRVEAAPAGRVVTVSSIVHRGGRIRFEDLDWSKGYSKWGAYAQSKLANLLFTFELQRRLARAGSRVKSVACHPGYASTNLQLAWPKLAKSSFMIWGAGVANRLLAQPAEAGAWPTLYAATGDDIQSGDYVGSGDFFEMRGEAVKVGTAKSARDEAAAARLWALSEELTGVHYRFGAESAVAAAS